MGGGGGDHRVKILKQFDLKFHNEIGLHVESIDIFKFDAYISYSEYSIMRAEGNSFSEVLSMKITIQNLCHEGFQDLVP